jgi:predicted DNA-binding protein (UPF0251 family)
VDLYRRVRLACAEGMSQREAARHFNISRDSVAKMMAFSVPPGFRSRRQALPCLFESRRDVMLQADRSLFL